MNLSKVILLLSLAMGALPSKSIAGPLEAPASPTNSASAMFTLQDIHNRITQGTPGVLRQGGFVEPSAGPTNGTGRTLNEIMNALPSATNATVAATAADVPSGLKFWGLSATGWGLQTGTAPVELNRVRSEVVTGISATNTALGKRLPTAEGGTGIIVGQFSVSGISAAHVTDKNGNPMTVVQAQNGEVQFTIPPGTGINRYTLSISNQVISPLSYLPSQSNGLFLAYDAPVITAVSGCTDNGSATGDCFIYGGNWLFIYGENFGSPSSQVSVTVGGITAFNVRYEAPEMLSCELPASPTGGYDLPVTVTVDGVSGSGTSLVSYEGPRPDAMMVDLGASHVATPFTITGNKLTDWGGPPTVKYGLPGQTYEQMPFTATVVGYSYNEIQCESQIGGAGSGLVYIVQDDLGMMSRPTGNLSHSAPEIISNTLRFPNGVPGNALFASSASGTVVQFDVINAGNVPELIKVAMGPSGGPYDIECELVSVVAFGPSGSTVQCTIPAGAGNDYHFVVTALNQTSGEGTDTFNYPVLPFIDSVSGCNDSSPGTTCNTAGGTTLTIHGGNFSPTELAVLVGGVFCRNVVYVDANTIQCTVPPGTGLNVPVVVKVGTHLSMPFTGFSYTPPAITEVQGALNFGNGTVQVSRNGTNLTINGSNFGASGARILVGGVLATGVSHDSESPHTKLSFTCPPRATPPFYDLPVTVLNASGNFSANSGTLSYE